MKDSGGRGPLSSRTFSFKSPKIKNIQLMKLRNILLCLALVGGLSTSCIKEDHSDCYNIYYLAMSYMGDGTTEIFPEKIDRVDMYVFDQQGSCVTSTRLSDSEMKAQLVKLPPLESGTYRIVCVGNAYETKVNSLESKDMAKISFAAQDYINGETVSGNDPLYWSAIDYVIEPYNEKKLEETKTTYFASSHYDVSVEITGVPLTKAGEMPVVQLVNVSPYTDFNNRAFGEPAVYTMETSFDGVSTMTSINNIMRHTNHKDVLLRVSRPNGEVLVEKNFADHINRYRIPVEDNEVLIPFKVAFDQVTAEVTVTVPSWYVVDVTPEFKPVN